jgi:quinone-modifying oxidoreductase subunit QmoB
VAPETKFEPVINLAYRQVRRSNLGLFDGYSDSNYICFPYETRRTGIYTAGNVRQTMTNGECIEDATGAALKAIQCLESTNRGMAVHPRSGDMSFWFFFRMHTVQELLSILSERSMMTKKDSKPTDRCQRSHLHGHVLRIISKNYMST